MPGAARHHPEIVRVDADLGLFDRLAGWRDRLLSDPRFQRWAAAFPLTRGLARRRARTLFDLCAGFVYSQILFACVRLRLFEILATGPKNIDVLAGRMSLPVESALRLVEAAISLKLVERRGAERFGLATLGAALLGNAGVAAMIEHHDMLYSDLRDPVALLRGPDRQTALAAYWAYAGEGNPAALDSSATAPYSALMSASQPLIADDVLDAYPFGRHRCLLDVGGGEGVFLCAAGIRAPRLRLVLFDLPSVADRASERLAAAGLSDRAIAVGGDFLADPLPGGADVATLLRVLHDHDDASALAILRAVHRAISPGGTLVLAEPVLEASAAEPVGAAYFGFYLLAMGSGRPRTADELMRMASAAGFRDMRVLRNRRPLLARVITGRA